MNILIFIDHDIMLRHFIDSEVFLPLANKFNVKIILPKKTKRITKIINKDTAGMEVLYIPIDEKRQYCWRTLFLVNKLRFKIDPQGRLLQKVYKIGLSEKVKLLYAFLGMPIIYSLFKLCSLTYLKYKHNYAFEKLLEDNQPDILIHPSVLAGLFIDDLIFYGKKKNIKSLVIMNSWDNPSTKQSVTGKPDWLFVWGEQTFKHAKKFMGINAEKIKKFGAAQFDLFRNEADISREEFCEINNIDKSKKILLYAGSSKGSDEFEHLQFMNDLIESNYLENAIIVYRPHPWGGGGKNGHRIIDSNWNNIIIDTTMRDYLNSIKSDTGKMSYPDYRNTHNLLSSVDAVISPLSTIILEAAMHGKPVMCFLPDDKDLNIHLELAKTLVHFDDMYNMEKVLVVHGKLELKNKLNLLVEQTCSDNFSKELKKSVEYFVEPYSASYGERLVEFIKAECI